MQPKKGKTRYKQQSANLNETPFWEENAKFQKIGETTNLFVPQLRVVRKYKIDFEFRRNGRRRRRPGLHKWQRGFGRFQIRNRISPCLHKSLVRNLSRRDIRGERPPSERSAEKAGGGVPEHLGSNRKFARLASRREWGKG